MNSNTRSIVLITEFRELIQRVPCKECRTWLEYHRSIDPDFANIMRYVAQVLDSYCVYCGFNTFLSNSNYANFHRAGRTFYTRANGFVRVLHHPLSRRRKLIIASLQLVF